MTTRNEASEAIYTRWRDNWTYTPYLFDNERPDVLPAVPWVRLVIRELEGQQETLAAVGNRRFLRRAMVVIQVFTELNQGIKASDELVHLARSVFEGTRFSGVWFLHGNVFDIGVTQEGLYQTNLQILFNYEEVK